MLAFRDLPNVLTIARLLMVGPLVYLLLTGNHVVALALALIAGFSDWLDGALARHFRWQSEFGGMLDPLADKLLMTATYAALTWLDHLPLWLLLLVIARDIVIVTGGVIYHYRIEPFRAEPTRLSKFNTVCQLLLMWAVLFGLAGAGVPGAVIEVLIWVVATTVITTMLQYVILWSRRARRILGGD
ncbi:MAG: CDP-alcohol phosphatidyltransferase family protein [Wenzhouxiangellaceae bacterium]|nr:CDP-alcohol phosphatidyltransferase family protein [Wenzhouxiangellaceae bacterium]